MPVEWTVTVGDDGFTLSWGGEVRATFPHRIAWQKFAYVNVMEDAKILPTTPSIEMPTSRGRCPARCRALAGTPLDSAYATGAGTKAVCFHGRSPSGACGDGPDFFGVGSTDCCGCAPVGYDFLKLHAGKDNAAFYQDSYENSCMRATAAARCVLEVKK